MDIFSFHIRGRADEGVRATRLDYVPDEVGEEIG